MEEIVLQGIGDAAQQGNVDIVLAENLVHMRASATDVVGQLCGRRALLPHYLFDMLPDVHKSVELIDLLTLGFPRPPYQQDIPRQHKIGVS